MEKRILILYENNHYITPYYKNCSFLNIYFFLSSITFFTLEVQGVFFFLIVSYLQRKPQRNSFYYVWIMTQCLGQKMLKVKSNKYYHCKTSKRYIKISGLSTLVPITFLHRIKTSGVKITPALKKSYLFHKLEEMKI